MQQLPAGVQRVMGCLADVPHPSVVYAVVEQ
jgi:hypothetical protein